jgi:hypothetical protein
VVTENKETLFFFEAALFPADLFRNLALRLSAELREERDAHQMAERLAKTCQQCLTRGAQPAGFPDLQEQLLDSPQLPQAELGSVSHCVQIACNTTTRLTYTHACICAQTSTGHDPFVPGRLPIGRLTPVGSSFLRLMTPLLLDNKHRVRVKSLRHLRRPHGLSSIWQFGILIC